MKFKNLQNLSNSQFWAEMITVRQTDSKHQVKFSRRAVTNTGRESDAVDEFLLENFLLSLRIRT